MYVPANFMELAKHKNNMRKYETIKNMNICMCEPAYNNNNNNRQTHRIIKHNKKISETDESTSSFVVVVV